MPRKCFSQDQNLNLITKATVSKPSSKIVARYCVPSFQPIGACEISQRSKLETSLWAFALPLEVTNTEK